jgi:threonine dehydratase
MPADAPRLKIENTRAYGAEVVLYDRATVDREALVRQVADEQGQHVILPFDDADVIAGQGTVGLEIAEQAAELGITRAHVLVCCGGGGLTAGIATALHATAPDMRVHPAEPAHFDDVARSLSTGTRQMNSVRSGSICDAILTPESGDLTWPIIRDLCGAGAVVGDDMALDAVAAAFQRLKLVVEPGGAVALAAALWALPDGVAADVPVIAVATGGNVDADIFARALERL